jgi:hypothetical protein
MDLHLNIFATQRLVYTFCMAVSSGVHGMHSTVGMHCPAISSVHLHDALQEDGGRELSEPKIYPLSGRLRNSSLGRLRTKSREPGHHL